MLARQFDALRSAVDSGEEIDFDGLRVVHEGDGEDGPASGDGGYTFATPEHEVTGLAESELHAHADGSPYVTNWYFWEREVQRHESPRRAFLRRMEAADDRGVHERYDALADGTVTEWGQLRIEATLGDDGSRRYDVRHVDNADHPVEELERYDDHDDHGDNDDHNDHGSHEE